MGNVLVPLAMFGWIPITIGLFAVLSPRRAFLASTLAGWMFLPVATYELPGFVDYTKEVAVSFSALIGVLVFDPDRLRKGAFHRFDVPLAIWCACPMVTSIVNELGAYDGLSGVLERLFVYYLPYYLGRIYLSSYAGLREFAIAVVLAALVYAPFCVWEARMSPQLHVQLYGFFAHEGGWLQVIRFGGFRPMVFMHHGLMLGFFMAVGAFMAFTLWISGAKRELFGVPMLLVFLFLLVVNILVKSSGSFALLAGALGVMIALRLVRTSIPYWALALIPLVYVVLRAPGIWDGSNLVDLVQTYIGADRADSIAYRLEAEELLANKALEQPIFGWGEHDRGRVAWAKSDDGLVVPDGLWIQAFNVNGVIGITSLLLLFLLPVAVLGLKLPPKLQMRSPLGLLTGMAVVTGIYMMDNLMNAMIAPMYFSILGGITGYAIANPGFYRRTQRRQKYRPSQLRWLEEQRGQTA